MLPRLLTVVLLALSIQSAHGQPSPGIWQGFERAIDHHARFQVCFKTKLTTDYCTITNDYRNELALPSVEAVAQRIAYRLTALSSPTDRTAALIFHEAPDGSVGVYLLDQDGLKGGAIRPDIQLADALNAMRSSYNIDTRSAQPLRERGFGSEVSASSTTISGISLLQLSSTVLPEEIGRLIEDGEYTRLLVLPSGVTSVVPFPALILPSGSQIVDVASVVILADLDALTLPFRRDAVLDYYRELYTFNFEKVWAGNHLVIGDPDYADYEGDKLPKLRGAEKEAEKVFDLFVGAKKILIGPDANHTNVTQKLVERTTDSGIFYFATHGLSSATNPMDESILALAERHLHAREIRDMNFSRSPPLVVLSACQTGLGRHFDGGTFGLLRAWYNAGAGQVVGSLWNVKDDGTLFLMSNFVQNLNNGVTRPEEALRQAMRTARTKFPNDPAIWASFYVFGVPSR